MYVSSADKMWALSFVIGSAVILLGIIIGFALRKKHITIYRPYEEELLNNGKLKLQEYIDYISKWNFNTYAALSIGMVLVTVTLLLLNKSSFFGYDVYIISVILCLLSVATVSFVIADFIHTNSLTPIIPIKRRFDLVDISITLHQVGLYSMLYSILLYLSLINPWATFISSIAIPGIAFYGQRTRSIKKAEFFKYFEVTQTEGWKKQDHEFIEKATQDNEGIVRSKIV